MSQILLMTRGLILDDESGNNFGMGSVLNSITYKDNENNLNTFYDVIVKYINYKYVHIHTDIGLIKIKINDIVSWS